MTYTDVYLDQYGSTMAITLLTDVSHYQGTIDWAAVARTSYRAGVARMTIGRSTRDDRGRANLHTMLGTMPVAGAYGVVGYSEPVTDGAKLLLDEISAAGADPAKILVMLDAENFGDGSHPTIDQVDAYAQQLHADLGRWPIAYVPGWWLGQHGYTASGRGLANCPWAPSHYIDAPWTEARLLAVKPALRYGFKSLAWLQYTSSATAAGVAGRVDANCYYGTLDQLRAQLLGAQPQEDDVTIDEFRTELRRELTTVGTPSRQAIYDLMARAVAGDETVKALKQALDAGLPLSLSQAQLDEVKAALQRLEGSALIQLAVSPATP